MRILFLFLIVFMPAFAGAETAGTKGLSEVRQCIMQNDVKLCHNIMTSDSYEIFDRFMSYKLMPCLPTDFTYESEQVVGQETIAKVNLPADNKTHYVFRMVFTGKDPQVKLDLPETFHVGFGEKWQEKVNLSEQIYLLMKQSMKDKLTCDMLQNLFRKPAKS